MNIRQSGRRRGRSNSGGGNRGSHDNGNRIDNRARGNALQLIEKYRNMARDAQLSGDRVQTEYYLQFADHYFRVHSDAQARRDEGRGQPGQGAPHDNRGGGRRDARALNDFDDGPDFDGEQDDRADDRPSASRDVRQDARHENRQDGRPDRDRGQDGPRDAGDLDDDGDVPAERAPRRKPRAPRREGAKDDRREDARDGNRDDEPARLPADMLPPAIGTADRSSGNGRDQAGRDDGEADGAEPAPRVRRPRRSLKTSADAGQPEAAE